ncbi:hypothetical protein RJ639_040148 [Escallonia herrerae]|uniref:Uncharacterized protein n=1 Tax=Escallonia herrerae TaxID=1293975 RepID=A0AA89BBH5_9ASTE|nr:hypothetical protein RJ639_040148 [Escallonia herrerae]
MASQCPTSNAFRYNATLCACSPGYFLNATSNACQLFQVDANNWLEVNTGVDYSINLPYTFFFSFDSIRRFTQSQAIFLESTLVLLFAWLLLCFLVRFGSLGDGRTPWFKIRWWISRLDVAFATRHWLELASRIMAQDDQKVVKKRKTELGGAFSIASWILFIGLFAALLYQALSKRTVEVHNVRATNAPDLASFVNDLEFNITTVSSMSCSHLRDLGTLVMGNPGFIDQRVAPLSSFANYSCQNTTKGPKITIKCNGCQLIRDSMYTSWKFIDLPNDPAIAVGFEFNVTAKNHANKRHLSFVSGRLKNGSNLDDRPTTYRGPVPNILKFNFFPRVYHNLHDLKLVQPLFHEFLPGSSSSEISQLQGSLQSSNNGLINTTLSLNFLTDYIVEIDNQNALGPVSFLADLGGLYCISIGIFFYFLVQFEYRIKKFRNEDGVMRKIRNRRKAQDRWDKLRKYVTYTWGCSSLRDDYQNVKQGTCCSGFMIETTRKEGSSLKQGQLYRKETISFNRKVNLPVEKVDPELIHSQGANSSSTKSASTIEGKLPCPKDEEVLEGEVFENVKHQRHEHAIGSNDRDAIQPSVLATVYDYTLPPPPSFEFGAGSEVSVADLHKNLQNLFEYNAMLRERLAVAQSMLHALSAKCQSSAVETRR